MRDSTSNARSDPVAVVSGCDISGYGIMRSLGRHGVSIAALTDHTQDFARFSRYCHHTIEYPPVNARFSANCPSAPNAAQVTERLLQWAVSQPRRPILFATSDWFVAILVQQQVKLSAFLEYAWLSPETYALIKDKASISAFCLRAAVDAPRSARPHFVSKIRKRTQRVLSVPGSQLERISRPSEEELEQFLELEASGWKEKNKTAITSRPETKTQAPA